MQRRASADWKGSLREGMGRLSAMSGVFRDLPYSYSTRFGDQHGTNPEELIASAHAGCFTMALSGELEKLGFRPKSLHTDATAVLQQENSKWRITGVHLSVSGDVPGVNQEQFEKAAKEAKTNCPVSRLFNTNITLESKLLSSSSESSRIDTDVSSRSSSYRNPQGTSNAKEMNAP